MLCGHGSGRLSQSQHPALVRISNPAQRLSPLHACSRRLSRGMTSCVAPIQSRPFEADLCAGSLRRHGALGEVSAGRCTADHGRRRYRTGVSQPASKALQPSQRRQVHGQHRVQIVRLQQAPFEQPRLSSHVNGRIAVSHLQAARQLAWFWQYLSGIRASLMVQSVPLATGTNFAQRCCPLEVYQLQNSSNK